MNAAERGRRRSGVGNGPRLTDANAHSEIDTSFFVLTVDLWSGDASREVNLVRHSATSPSISAATSSSYPPPSSAAPNFHATYANTQPQPVPLAPGYPQPLPQLTMHQQMASHNAYQQGNISVYPPNYTQHPYQQSIPPPPLASQPQQGYYNTTPTGTPITPTYYSAQMQQNQGPLLSPHAMPPVTIDPRSSPTGMFTRNLIGSLCVSAFKLTDPENNMGVWFILQDLSVRTEGTFRLKMNFVNVGTPSSPSVQSLNNGSAPVLASTFSKVFQVFSAKKFPGVIESTQLSKCFATQGIKIPIRKDGPRGNARDRDDDDGLE
ncbi:hypothetical protein MMC07_007853 [Pseudocyphellaria aurata]|nr:hypothetical protein [Pseudocyphellaria aurata]